MATCFLVAESVYGSLCRSEGRCCAAGGNVARETVDERRTEFYEHVWDHTVDPFQASFDARRPLFDIELAALAEVVKGISSGEDDDDLAALIKKLTLKEPALIFPLLQVSGLTRNKILTDLRASTANTGASIPSSAHLLPRREVWTVAGPYLASRLRKVLEHVAQLPGRSVPAALESLNQATWPGWIRQERAKRQGHEAEYRLATLLVALDLPFQPIEKSENPLCQDAQVHGVSFDIVVPDLLKPLVMVKSTVQTSNIGQFGESKGALEVIEASQMIDSNFSARSRPTLLALVDGVGFNSNRAGLDGILENADEFCQFSTLWKGAVVAANATKMKLQVALPLGDEARHESFLDAHHDVVSVVELTDAYRAKFGTGQSQEAGEALIRHLR
jgi:hypothetical protein